LQISIKDNKACHIFSNYVIAKELTKTIISAAGEVSQEIAQFNTQYNIHDNYHINKAAKSVLAANAY